MNEEDPDEIRILAERILSGVGKIPFPTFSNQAGYIAQSIREFLKEKKYEVR